MANHGSFPVSSGILTHPAPKLIIPDLLSKKVQEPRTFVVRQWTACLPRLSPLVVAKRAVLTIDEGLAVDLMGVFDLLVIPSPAILFLEKCIGHIGGDALV